MTGLRELAEHLAAAATALEDRDQLRAQLEQTRAERDAALDDVRVLRLVLHLRPWSAGAARRSGDPDAPLPLPMMRRVSREERRRARHPKP